MPYWKGKIRPFRDRPDIERDYIWYAVPINTPWIGWPIVFTDRFWEAKENWKPPGVGTVPGTMKVLPGRPRIPPAGKPEGTPDQWLNGFLYSDYISGRLPVGTCIPVGSGQAGPRVRQRQSAFSRPTLTPSVREAQSLYTVGCPSGYPDRLFAEAPGAPGDQGPWQLDWNPIQQRWEFDGLVNGDPSGFVWYSLYTLRPSQAQLQYKSNVSSQLLTSSGSGRCPPSVQEFFVPPGPFAGWLAGLTVYVSA
jgi:hypothetical protein